MPLHTWISTPSIIAGLLVVQYVLNSYLIYTRVSHPLHVLWIECNVDMQRHFPAFPFSDLEQIGFRLAGYLLRSEGGRVFYLAVFVHPQNRDSAEVFVFDGASTFLTLPIFKSRFADGFAFEVGNSGVAPHQISGGPSFPAFNFPNVRSTAELYRIHGLLKREFSNSRVPTISDGSAEVREFARKAEEVHNYSMSHPDYKISADRTQYAFTLKGAMRAAWLHQWPVAPIKRWCALRSAIQHTNQLEKSASDENGQ